MVLVWALYGLNSPHGANTRPTWAEICEYAHLVHAWVKRGLEC